MTDFRDSDQDDTPVLPTDISAIIGIGVARSSLASLSGVLSAIDPGLGGVYLVAVGGEDPPSAKEVLEAAAQGAGLAVTLAEDGAVLQPEHVYVAGSAQLLTVEAGRIALRPQREHAETGAVDTMLYSIARAAGRRSVALILNGLKSEGAVGLRATKECGGLSIGEWDPGDADGSETSGPSGVLDIRGTPSRIAAEIDLYIGNIAVVPEASLPSSAEAVESQIAEIVAALRRVTGNDFHGYKRGTFVRRVQRRVQVLQLPDIAAYVEILHENREEVQRLFQDLLIGVTQFFRDPSEFDLLERELPTLFRGKRPDDTLRIWVLGCATGEEAYSIAILVKEYAATLETPPRIQIFATDLDSRALGLARAGRYGADISGHVRADRLERWFTREGDTYLVAKELREICIFSPHNLVKDPPFSRIDLLSCRNLLIYLNIDIQNRTIPLFHFALRPGGLLMLGTSENVTRHQSLFAPVDRRNRLFRRLEPATRVVPDFPQSGRIQGPPALPGPEGPVLPARLSDQVSRQADAVAERFTPAYAVVDAQFEVLHFSGRIGPFLEPLSGAASLNLINLVHRDLRVELRSGLYRATTDGRRVELLRQAMKTDGSAVCVNIIIEPLSREHITSLVVVFQNVGPAQVDGAADDPGAAADEHVSRLESELRLTRERLQATIEELESTNEELRSSNEEYQSINEEMQSTNEELETSKEELQSVNEELQTVNLELSHQVGELARSNSDIKNLLEATQIATLFLDNELRLRNFTPSATEVFHLLETDMGRPLDHVVARISYPEIQEDVHRVMKTLAPVDRTVLDPARGRHYAVRVLPYRSIDNFIGGTVLTFTDLTAARNAEQALRDSEERFRSLVGTWAQAVWEADAEGRIIAGPEDGTAQGWLDLISAEDRAAAARAWAQAVQSRQPLNADFRLISSDAAEVWTNVRAAPLFADDGSVRKWAGMNIDISARKLAQKRLTDSERQLDSLMRGLPQLIWRAAEPGRWTWASPQWLDYTGQTADAAVDWGWLEAVHPDDRPAASAAWAQAETEGFEVEFRLRSATDGLWRWFQTRATPVQDEDGHITHWFGTSTDVNELHCLQDRQRVLAAELQHRTRNLLSVVRQIARRTQQSASDLADFGSRFRDRLEMLARVQSLLSTLVEDAGISFSELVISELSAVGADPGDRVVVSGPDDVTLRPAAVQMLAMALHELATNSVKYGALGQAAGRLIIRWRVETAEARDLLHIDWQEQGVTMPDTPARPGQGRELIEQALPYQLDARTRFEMRTDGISCEILLPL